MRVQLGVAVGTAVCGIKICIMHCSVSGGKLREFTTRHQYTEHTPMGLDILKNKY